MSSCYVVADIVEVSILQDEDRRLPMVVTRLIGIPAQAGQGQGLGDADAILLQPRHNIPARTHPS